jgi:hypothetical protein
MNKITRKHMSNASLNKCGFNSLLKLVRLDSERMAEGDLCQEPGPAYENDLSPNFVRSSGCEYRLPVLLAEWRP